MDNIDLTKYQTLIFDCDGVVLDSNKIKTQAFYDVAKVYGHTPAQRLKDYHVMNGGISRYKKFEYFLTEILDKDLNRSELGQLLMGFSREVKKSLLACEVADGLDELKAKYQHSIWLIVSGGDQNELREVFVERGLDKYFNGGIYGSPDSKDIILEREKINKNIIGLGAFFGDSKYDQQVASQAGLDFYFISKWTEVNAWQEWLKKNKFHSFEKISDLC